ncbi:putative ABC transport system ATP-binding protein [Mycetocola sp. BIGb0189]|uniref:ABC transporter transmembrane domain-containing protein n=1 Tax=Mycetocola sp. BIGb0189 TaxID=2940604 RepID=UPI002166E3A2|nr:ABC transporter ATP-binding protein [Mycetocola sp. BIGb0189]MCS4275308.1 putative ABC transport system ATP-binding protein [Mycetocola sp. BIGb0189]
MPASSVSPQSLIRHTLAIRRTDLVLATILYGLHQLGEALVPVIIGATIGTALAGADPGALLMWIGILAADFLLLSFSYRLGARASMRAKQHGEHSVRMMLSARVLDPAGGVDQAPGDLLARADSDAGRIGAFAGMLATCIAAALVLIASTIMLLIASLPLGIVIMVGTVLLLVALGLASRPVQRRSRIEQDDRGRVIVLAEDLVRGLRVLRGLGASGAGARQYAEASGQALQTTLHATAGAATLTAVGAALTGTYLALITVLGGSLALSGALSAGELVAALGLARFVIGPMDTLAFTGTAIARARASAERVTAILNSPIARADLGSEEAGSDPVLEVFRVGPLPGRTTPLSLRLDTQQLTGIVTEDPRTAQALIALLAREGDPESGSIRLGGTPFPDLDARHLTRRVLVSPHDAALFAGSLRAALTEAAAAAAADPAARGPHTEPAAERAAETATEATMHDSPATFATRAAHAAHVEEVAEQAPTGWNSDIGERGGALSGGQRQRLALARALAADPDLLVLHDPTTAVDAATEQTIAERVATLRAGRGTAVFTSSPAWLTRCDRVIFLPADTAPTEGTHRSLGDSDTRYLEAVLR